MAECPLHVFHTLAGLSSRSGGPARTVTSLCAGLLGEMPQLDLTLFTQGRPGEDIYYGALAPDRVQVADGGSRLRAATSFEFRRTVRAAVARGAPDILHDHGIWLPANFFAGRLARRHNIPFALHPRGMLEPWALRYRSGRKRIAWHVYQKNILAGVNVFFATSEAEAQSIRTLGFRQPVAIIPNGIELPELNPDTLRRDPAGSRKTALFLSRIHPKKGLLELLQAWAEVQPIGWRLCLAGPDEESHLEEVMGLVRRLNLMEQVEYVGEADEQSKAALYGGADLFVLPSFSENFGVVVAEALSYGIPVLTTTATPWRALVERDCGWWVGTGAAALAPALAEATTLGPQERLAMGDRARDYAREFTWDSIACSTLAVYSWMLGRCDPPDCLHID